MVIFITLIINVAIGLEQILGTAGHYIHVLPEYVLVRKKHFVWLDDVKATYLLANVTFLVIPSSCTEKNDEA